MKCRDARKLMVELFDRSPVEQPELMEHLASCPDCSRAYKQGKKTLEILKPRHTVCASPDFKKRVMSEIRQLEALNPIPEKTGRSRKKIWIPAIAVAALALLFFGIPYLDWNLPFGIEQKASHPLLAQAMAAERDILGQGGIVHFVKEVTFHPVKDTLLAKMRLHFLPLIGPDGKMLFNQLTLPDEAARGFTVQENSWFDFSSKRFALIVRIDGKPVFVNSFDGEIVRTTEAAADGRLKIVEKPISGAFAWPEELNENIGVSGDVEKMLQGFDEEHISEAGEGTLEDGTPVRLVKAETLGPEGKLISSCLIKIRKTDNTFAEMDFSLREETIMTLRFTYHKPVAESSVPWSLQGIESLAYIPGTRVDFDMIKPDVSVRQMLDKADFPAYLIHPEPSWTVERKVSVISMNIPGMNRKMSICIAVYRGRDDRHVVLSQSNMYSQMAGAIMGEGTKVYTSPHGFEVWRTDKDEWTAKINLKAARGVIRDMGRPAEDCTGCTIITPDRPVIMLAVNGKLSDKELHQLADNLVLVDEYFGRQALESGALDVSGESGRLALLAAVGMGLDDKVRQLLDAGVDPNSFNPNSKMHALWLACARGRVQAVKDLIAAGAVVSSEKPLHRIPLFRAVDNGHIQIVKLLLESGAQVDARNSDDLTSLFFAASRGDSAMVKILLQARADVNARNSNGVTSLFFAAGRGDSAMVSILLKAGAYTEVANEDNVTPLMLAAKRGYTEVTKALIAAGADVNAADKDGKPLLMHAMDLDEYVEVIRLLIASGANVNAAMPDGWTALQHAKDKGRIEIVALLKESGAKE